MTMPSAPTLWNSRCKATREAKRAASCGSPCLSGLGGPLRSVAEARPQAAGETEDRDGVARRHEDLAVGDRRRDVGIPLRIEPRTRRDVDELVAEVVRVVRL